MKSPSKIALVFCVLGLMPLQARAQASATNGIKIGQGRVHPSLELEMRLDSAAGYFGAPPTLGTFPLLSPEWVLAIRPGLRSELVTASHALQFSGMLEYLHYTGLISEPSSVASRFQGNLSLGAQANRGAELGFDLSEQLTRSDRNTNPVAGVGLVSLFNQVKAAVPWRPGGGTLELTPSAGWSMELFDAISPMPFPTCAMGTISCDPAVLQGMNYNNFSFGLAGRWRFFPKTAMSLSATYDTRTFSDPRNPAVQLLRGTLGVTGLLTTKLSAVANAGYGYDLAASGGQTAIGHLELSYRVSSTVTIKGGYLRSLEPIPVYGSYSDDRGYLEGRMLLNGRLTLRARTSLDYLGYYFNAGRYDLIFGINSAAEYQLSQWMVGSLGYVMSAQSSNDPNLALNYARHEGMLRVTFTY